MFWDGACAVECAGVGRGELRWWQRVPVVLLCVVLVFVVVDYHKPERVEAVAPIAVGVVIGAGAIAVLTAIALTYAASPDFQSACDEVGASIAEGLVVQSLIDNQVTRFITDTVLIGLIDDFRLFKACATFIQSIPGAWAKVEDAAAGAVSWAGNVYYDVRDLWLSFGFAGVGGLTLEANPAGFSTGEIHAVNLDGWGEPHHGNALANPAPAFNAATQAVLDGALISGAQQDVLRLGISAMVWDADFAISSDWYGMHYAGGSSEWQGAAAGGVSYEFFCRICGAYSTANAAQVVHLNWPGTGIGSATEVGALGSATWLLTHMSADHSEEYTAIGDTAGTTFPDGTVQPGTTVYPQDVVDAVAGATTFPAYPSRGIVPPYVPPASVWDGTTPGFDNALGDVADGIDGWADGLTGSTDGVFDALTGWLTGAMATIAHGLAAIIRWLANVWVSAEALIARWFTVNPDWILDEFGQTWDDIHHDWDGTALGAGVGIVAAFIDSLDAGAIGGSDLEFHFHYSQNGSVTIHLSEWFEYVDPYRGILALLVLVFLALGLVRLFRPQVSV